MKPLSSLVVTAIIAVAACTPEPATNAATQFVGKQLVAGEDVFLFSGDGTIGGTLRGETLEGVYTATSTEICSTYTSPDFLVGQEYCSTPAVEGTTVIFNRRDGSQSQSYEIMG